MQTHKIIAIASLLACAGAASAQLTAYNDQAAWEAALADLGLTPITETFDGIASGELNPGDSPFDLGDFSITVEGFEGRASIAGGLWNGSIVPDRGHEVYVHNFDQPIIAFGQNYISAASGLGIQIETIEGTIDIFDDGGYDGNDNGFFGFISVEPVLSVRIINSDDGVSTGETYTAEDALYAFGESVFRASGTDAASIQAGVDTFRAALGELNRPEPGSVGSGRREINWDGVPDEFATPNAFPGDFFNGPAFPRARGAEFSTPGSEFQVSATLASGIPVEFGNFRPGFTEGFEAFSAERLFSPLGSSRTFVDFFVPGTQEPATTRGFGAVFSDVDLSQFTTITLFDEEGESLGVWEVPEVALTAASFSFLGILFDEPIIARAEIRTGRFPIDGDQSGDFVVMDDFIYGEPMGVCSADCDGSGSLDIFDFLCFQNHFDEGQPEADCDGSGSLDIFDFLCFQNAFDAGCQ